MGYMIELTENKYDKMSEYAEKMLKYGGKLMSCISEMGEEHGYGHREGYGMRYGSGSSINSRYGYGMRDDEDWDEMDERYDDMNERRGRRRRDSRGRYM